MALVQVNTRWTQAGGKTCSFKMDYATLGDPTLGDLAAMADDTASVIDLNLGLWTADISFGTVQAFTFVRTGAGTEADPYARLKTSVVIDSAINPGDGTAVGQALPPQNAFVVSFKTLSAGRRFFGRVYTPAPPEAIVDAAGSLSDSAARAAFVQDIATAVESSLTPTDVDHIVYSLTYDEQAEVATYGGGSRIDTQRRRLGPGR